MPLLCRISIYYSVMTYLVVAQVEMVCRKPDCDAAYLPGELACSLLTEYRFVAHKRVFIHLHDVHVQPFV